MSNPPIWTYKDGETFLKELLRSAYHDVDYYFRELTDKASALATFKDICLKANIPLLSEGEMDERDEDDDELADSSIEETALARLVSLRNSVKHYEEYLAEANKRLGTLQGLLARAGYKLDLEEIQNEVRARDKAHKPLWGRDYPN